MNECRADSGGGDGGKQWLGDGDGVMGNPGEGGGRREGGSGVGVQPELSRV